MSADSPKRSLHKGAQVVTPQPISDKSIIDSVAGIINDIVPQAYTGIPNADNKELITWARFEYVDVNDPLFYPDFNEGSTAPPLLLVLGYTVGVQVWLIAASGEATEILSWHQGVVRTLRILPSAKDVGLKDDPYKQKRPLVAICDSAGPGPQFCNVSFISLKTGEQIKSIKFKSPVCDVLANKRSIVVTFPERIAVFDAKTLEDVLTITTCYPSPGPNPNPVALGTRWLAYSEKKLIQSRRSSGGRNAEGVQSYTATVLYAAKSLGKGLRGLGETVASSFTGNSTSPVAINNVSPDITQAGVVTILDLQAAKEEKEQNDSNIETVIAHFTAHTDPIVALTFDSTGALLMTADKRGHDFYVFRIHPHPGGPSLAAVHHLYTLHRGDTTAKVQDMVFSTDARWAAISTVRGTTHVFPVTPYGGSAGMRTHSSVHVVNRLSRFHRSAGLTDDSIRSQSPITTTEQPGNVCNNSNPRLPPYPVPTTVMPLAQIRQPTAINPLNNQTQPRIQQKQKTLGDENTTLSLKLCACFAPPRAWIYSQRETTCKIVKRAVDSLFIMACHGNMIQYDLEIKPLTGVPKEKICDDTPIELEVEAKGQWPLLRTPNFVDVTPPLATSNPLISLPTTAIIHQQCNGNDGNWLSQVEIFTHAGPHRRLWMGPQFSFKIYNAPSGVPVNMVEAETVEINVTSGSRPARSNPVNMPHNTTRHIMPLVIDGSGSSYEQSPRFVEAYGDALDHDSIGVVGCGESQLKEDLAEAMLETLSTPNKISGRPSLIERVGQPVTRVVNPLGNEITVSAVEEDNLIIQDFEVQIESIHEPPRSVCAEEGPASLGDLEVTEGQDLREHTEICAEMSRANEPAIVDIVPHNSIKDVKEKKALCAEEAVHKSVGTHSNVDFDKIEAFYDVPNDGKVCAEKGAIPDSPMTQAKEVKWSMTPVPDSQVNEFEQGTMDTKFILSQDEECAVITEPKNHSISRKKPTTKQSMNKKSESNNGSKNPHSRSFNDQSDKYLKKKTKKDSVKVDYQTDKQNQKESFQKKNIYQSSSKVSQSNLDITSVSKKNNPADMKKGKRDILSEKCKSPMVDLECMASDQKIKQMVNLSDRTQLVDDSAVLETSKESIKINIDEIFNDEEPTANVKNLDSDDEDDLEHVNPTDIVKPDITEVPRNSGSFEHPIGNAEIVGDSILIAKANFNSGLSSDDDIEHITHFELKSHSISNNLNSSNTNIDSEIKMEVTSNFCSIKESKTSDTNVFEGTDNSMIKKDSDSNLSQHSLMKKTKSRVNNSSCNTTSNKKSQHSTLDDMVEIIRIDPDEILENMEVQLQPEDVEVQLQPEVSKSSSKYDSNSLDMVEIIDIDAMERADKVNHSQLSECTILLGCSDQMNTRKKSKRYRKSQNLESPVEDSVIMSSKLIDDFSIPTEMPSVCGSWNSITKRKNSLKCDGENLKKLEPLIEIGDSEDNKENVHVDDFKISDSSISTLKQENLAFITLEQNNEIVEKSMDCLLDSDMEHKSLSTKEDDTLTLNLIDSANVENSGKQTSLEESLIAEYSCISNRPDPKIIQMDVEEDNGLKDQSNVSNNVNGATGGMCISAASKKANRWKKKKRR